MTPLCCDNLGTYMFVFGFDFAVKTRDYKVVSMVYAHGDGQYLLPPRVRYMDLVQESGRILMLLFQI